MKFKVDDIIIKHIFAGLKDENNDRFIITEIIINDGTERRIPWRSNDFYVMSPIHDKYYRTKVNKYFRKIAIDYVDPFYEIDTKFMRSEKLHKLAENELIDQFDNGEFYKQ